MKRFRLLPISVALVLIASVGTASGQNTPPSPTTRYQMSYEIQALPARPLDLVQTVLEFAPGSFTSLHTDGGPTFVTVLEGEVTRRTGSTDETVRASQGWAEPTAAHAAGNLGSSTARVLVTAFVPYGVPSTTAAAAGTAGQLPPGPHIVGEFRGEVPEMPSGPYLLQHDVLDFAAGAVAPAHTHGGPSYLTVLDGTMWRRAEAKTDVYEAGATWVEPGVPHAAGARSSGSARVGVAVVIPTGHSETELIDEARASDGLGLSTETWPTRAGFMAVWGDGAAARWASEHETELRASGR
jgi:quercetin dioxygenase-like cupin family protein